jgi:hypothetical protein
MAYSRFADSDIYIYSHIDGYIECCACWLNEGQDEYSKDTAYSLFLANVQIYDDIHLARHLKEHAKLGHEMPSNLLQEILQDDDRYG